MTSLEINLHEKQLEIFNSFQTARFLVIACGRRFGKTYLCAFVVIYQALTQPKQNIWIVAPTFPQTDILWEMVIEHLPKDRVHKIFEGKKLIELRNGSRIWAKSADNPQGLVGRGLDLIVFDEASMCDIAAWNYMRPALGDRKGKCIFPSCVTKDTFIITGNALTTMNELPFTGEPGEHALIEQVYGKDGFKQSSHIYENGKTETLKVTVEGNYSIEGTRNHPIWAREGKYRLSGRWMKLDELHQKCYVAIQLNQQVFGNKDELIFNHIGRKPLKELSLPKIVTKDFSYLIGLILGDGSVFNRGNMGKGFTITSKDEEILSFLRNKPFGLNFSEQNIGNGTYHLTAGSVKFYSVLQGLGYDFVTARNKKIPTECLKWSKENICSLLSGLFDTDGHCTIKTTKDGIKKTNVGFSSTSIELIKQIRMLLLNLGIVTQLTTIHARPTEKVKAHSTEYQIAIADQIGVMRFFDQIGFRIKRKSDKHIPTSKVYGDRKRIYHKLGDCEVLWKKVKHFESKQNETFDFHIPDGHSFFSNGFISHNTPKGKNWFYDIFMKDPRFNTASSDNDYRSYQYPSMDNQFLDPNEFISMTKDLPQLMYKQEILAEFIESGGEVFRNLSRVLEPCLEEPKEGHFYIGGGDLGKYQDFTVLMIADLETNKIVYYERFNKLDWDYQKVRIASALKRYNDCTMYIDSTGVGDPIVEDLQRQGCAVRAFKFSLQTKKQAIENLMKMIDDADIRIPNLPEIKHEFEIFGYEQTQFGNIRYCAPDGQHDDIVIASALCAWGLGRGNSAKVVGVPGGYDTPVPVNEEEVFANYYDDKDQIIDWNNPDD